MRDDHLLPAPVLDGWRQHAACSGHDTNLWFDPNRQAEGLAICDQCPVQAPCAAEGRREEGIWGGQAETRFRVGTLDTIRCEECGCLFTRRVVAGNRPKVCGYRCRQDRNLRLAKLAAARRAS